ncbi:MAG: hypothetical protein Q4F97_06975 [Bacteroidales bacterium]|nr:hypothetical protein [Bacteroidales bacterium]
MNYCFDQIVSHSKAPLDYISPLYGKTGFNYASFNNRYRVSLYSIFNDRKSLSGYNSDGESNIQYATNPGKEGNEIFGMVYIKFKGRIQCSKLYDTAIGIEKYS